VSTPNRRFEFDKRGEFFISTHNEALTVATTPSATKIVRPLESKAETQPHIQPALLRLSAMIFQYFTTRIMRVAFL
jgi:hypothetical protein